MTHIRAYRQAIDKEQQRLRLNELKSFEVKKRLKALTESSTQKLKQISAINTDIMKYKSPYLMKIKRRGVGSMRCETEKNYTECEYEGSPSVYLS